MLTNRLIYSEICFFIRIPALSVFWESLDLNHEIYVVKMYLFIGSLRVNVLVNIHITEQIAYRIYIYDHISCGLH